MLPAIDDGRRFHRDATGWRICLGRTYLRWTVGIGGAWQVSLYRVSEPTKERPDHG
jgi:hypothetical protein